jgi:hypothetical protein
MASPPQDRTTGFVVPVFMILQGERAPPILSAVAETGRNGRLTPTQK